MIFALALTASGQDITGDWYGTLKTPGGKLTVVLHISKNGNTYSSTMDSPDQGVKGIPMSAVTLNNDTLVLTHKDANIRYRGFILGKDSVSGTFTQAGQSFPLGLSRKLIVQASPKRPQDPVKPYPYREENVSFLNPKGNFTLAGTLTLPAEGNKFPVVILITGSGPQNRNEELLGHRPFLVWADYLTRRGIAVLRCDDRGSYESKGEFSTATTFDFATDVEAAINYLKSRKDINLKKIGLMGHSEGGLIAPLVASRNKDVAFIVMLAGPGISGGEILLRQQALIAKVSGQSDKDIEISRSVNAEIFRMVNEIQQQDTLQAQISRFLHSQAIEHPGVVLTKGSSIDDAVNIEVKTILNPWVLSFIRYNPEPTLEKVKCPVLAIIGSKDLQVPADANLPVIEKALKKAGNRHYTVKELPGLNHLFQECNTGAPAEYGQIEQTISPSALQLVGDWIKVNTK